MNGPAESRLTGSGRMTGRVVKDRFGRRRELLWRIDLQLAAPPGGEISMVDIRLPVWSWQDLPGTEIVDGPKTRRSADGEFLSTTGAGPVRIGTDVWTGRIDRLTFGKLTGDDSRLDVELVIRELSGAGQAVIEAVVDLVGVRIDDDPGALEDAGALLDLRDVDVTRDDAGVLLRPIRER
ncbi:MAG TPA: hypothetical protein VIU11_09410 [Nakamurella sp.]